LTNISFAPSRTHNNQQQAAESTETGYSFTITGLDAGTKYDYQFSVLNDSNESIDEYFGEFTTHSTTAVEQISSAEANCQKLLRDGQLIILRDGKTYNTMGAEIR
jgi:phosphodiesterase/alkaline phosphatase D-like protein